VALYLCYYLYKNVALAWGDVVYAHDVGFNGNTAFPEWLSTAFNAAFTCWPVVLVLAFDADVPDEVALRTPGLYVAGPLRERFNALIFGKWMLLAGLHGVLAWACPVFGQVPEPGSWSAWRTWTSGSTTRTRGTSLTRGSSGLP